MTRGIGTFDNSGSTIYKRLTSIYGIGRSSAYKICKHFDVLPHTLMNELSEQQIHKITGFLIKNFLIESDLKKEINADISRLTSISCYRGARHKVSLPLRGQRTSTNAKTQKRIGNRHKGKRN